MTSIQLYLYVGARAPKKEGFFLDVGCGRGTLGLLLRAWGRKNEMIGVDIWEEYLEDAKKNKVYDHLICCDARYLPFRKKTFVFTASIELLEHLPKEDGFSFIKELECVTDGVLVITTPKGFMSQPEDVWRAKPYEKHLSGWHASELRRLGFKVRGLPNQRKKRSLFIPQALSWYLLLFAQYLIAIKET